LEDVLDPHLDKNVNHDVAEVINYISATDYAVARLMEQPLCNRLLKETHSILMKGVRGQERQPGEFRRSQNWIGGYGSTLANARYIPPSPEDMLDAMSDLEKYINSEDDLDALIRAALIHYQFETIHPFLDGNGRIGRLLITLFLMDKGILRSPVLYVSYFLKKNRIEYYDRMTEVRDKGNYEQWVKFFLQAVLESAEDAVSKTQQLALLDAKNTAAVAAMGRAAKSAMALLDYLKANPIIEIQQTARDLGLSFNTVASAAARLCDAGILVLSKVEHRSRIFCYEAYLELLREGT
jgi:Fic family protein